MAASGSHFKMSLHCMNSMPAWEGALCPSAPVEIPLTGPWAKYVSSILVPAGGHGFNGCGCHIIVGMDITRERAIGALDESWIDLANDSNDALGNQFAAAKWVCNYPIPAGTNSAWALP